MKLPSVNRTFNFSDTAHTILNVALPLIAVALVFAELEALAIAIVLLSKWRIFAVNPSFWFVNLRASAIDIIVGVGSVIMMSQTLAATNDSESQAVGGYIVVASWALQYLLWIFFVKPKTSGGFRDVQTIWATVVGTWALTVFVTQEGNDVSNVSAVIYYWLIGLSTARHFLSSKAEQFADGLTFLWGLFVVQIGWILLQWSYLFTIGNFLSIPQSSIIIAALTFIAMKVYTEYRQEKPEIKNVRWAAASVSIIIVAALLITDWSGING